MKKALLFVALATVMGFKSAEAIDLTPTGDVRFRYESLQNKYTGSTGNFSNDRWRTRVRAGLGAWINEELSAGVTFSTDSDALSDSYKGSTSRNQSYGNYFTPKAVFLSEAYVDYHPMNFGLDGKLNLLLGKRDVARTLIVNNDLLYDGDISLEGATLQYGKAADGKEKDGLVFIAGYYFLDQISTAVGLAGSNDHAKENDPYLTVFQLAYKGSIGDSPYLIGIGDNNFQNLRNAGSSGAADTNNVKVADRNVVELFGNFGGQLTETLPWKVYGQYAFNTDSHTDNAAIDNKKRKAWLAGVTFGDAKQPGQWAVDFNYNRTERDSVFPFFTDSDRKVGNYNSNTMGWEVGATYHLVQNMTVGLKYYNYRQIVGVEVGDPRLHTLQGDVVVKF